MQHARLGSAPESSYALIEALIYMMIYYYTNVQVGPRPDDGCALVIGSSSVKAMCACRHTRLEERVCIYAYRCVMHFDATVGGDVGPQPVKYRRL